MKITIEVNREVPIKDILKLVEQSNALTLEINDAPELYTLKRIDNETKS